MATLAEKKAFYASRGFTRETSVVWTLEGERQMTVEEFDEYIDKFCSDPTELVKREQIISTEANAWIGSRVQNYPKDLDQLEAAYKGFKYLRDVSGVDIGPDASAWVDAVDAVKAANPKPEGWDA